MLAGNQPEFEQEMTIDRERGIKPPRGRFSNEAYARLLALYESGIQKPNKALREELAKELNKTPRSIQIWFQNRRAKAKRHPSSPESQDSSPKKKPAPLNMKLVEQQRHCLSLSELSAGIPQSAASTCSFFDMTSPTCSLPPTPLHTTPIPPPLKQERQPSIRMYPPHLQPNSTYPTYYDEKGLVTPVSPGSRQFSLPTISSYTIMSPISEFGYFSSQEAIEPHSDLSNLTTIATGRKPQLQINTTLYDYGMPNDFLSPTSLLAPFQNATLNSPLDCGEACEAMKDPAAFLKWFNPPI